MPLQGNDNRSTRSWMPKAAVAPSAKWNSTYGVHYKNPAKRFSRNHEYWLRKASERAAASQQLAVQGLELEPRSHTFRSPSLALAFNQPMRNPSSLERAPSRGGMPGDTRAGSLTARPLALSIRETSVRSHNSFDAARSQSFYGTPYNVSALAMLEGQAAASGSVVPNQAIIRPHVERNYRATGAGHQPPMQRPQTARPAARYGGTQSLQYQQPQYLEDRNAAPSYGLYATLSPHNAWTDAPATQRPVYVDPSSSSLWQQTRPAAGLTQREEKLASPSSSTSPAVLARSHAFRPQLSTSASSPTIPANLLLNVAASPERTQKRAQEWQGGAYQEMEL